MPGLMLMPSAAQEITITTSQKHTTHELQETLRVATVGEQGAAPEAGLGIGVGTGTGTSRKEEEKRTGRHVSLARKRVVICMVTKLDLNMAQPAGHPL